MDLRSIRQSIKDYTHLAATSRTGEQWALWEVKRVAYQHALDVMVEQGVQGLATLYVETRGPDHKAADTLSAYGAQSLAALEGQGSDRRGFEAFLLARKSAVMSIACLFTNEEVAAILAPVGFKPPAAPQ